MDCFICDYCDKEFVTRIRRVKKIENELNTFIMGLVESKKVYTGKELENWSRWMGDASITKAFHNGWKTGVEVELYLSIGSFVSIGTVIKSYSNIILEILTRFEEKDNQGR